MCRSENEIQRIRKMLNCQYTIYLYTYIPICNLSYALKQYTFSECFEIVGRGPFDRCHKQSHKQMSIY